MADEDIIPGPINYLILIGISEYQDTTWNIKSCTKDCECIRDLLVTKYQNFKVYKELYNNEATREKIDAAIAAFNADEKVNNLSNNLIIFYSGHGGIYDTTKRKIGGWLPYDYK